MLDTKFIILEEFTRYRSAGSQLLCKLSKLGQLLVAVVIYLNALVKMSSESVIKEKKKDTLRLLHSLLNLGEWCCFYET